MAKAATAHPAIPARVVPKASVPSAARPCRKCSSSSARAKSSADAKRSAGTFSSARATTASTCRGTALRCEVTESGSLVMTFPRMACAVLPVYGGSPTSIS